MRIIKFSVDNFKSFRATGDVGLKSGITVVVGQNNVGKTALVQALGLTFDHQPHKSLRTMPSAGSPARGNSVVRIHFEIPRDEVLRLLARLGDFWVPTSKPNGSGAARDFSTSLGDKIILITTWVDGALSSAQFDFGPEWTGATIQGALLRVNVAGEIEAAQESISGINSPTRVEYALATLIKNEQAYAFDAERLHIGRSPAGASPILQTDAANLPAVLSVLERNPARFDKLRRLLNTILPAVQGVSVQPRETNQVEILVWTIDPKSEREDLAIPLSECGTGIGQVLAVLYVLLTAETPKVIIIDEPQSFLHPGAARKLIETLRQYPQHQFIITTHSPGALTAADPKTLLRLHVADGETLIEKLDIEEAKDVGLILADVGARLSDVFGADRILWVEGRTEESCFPRIIDRILQTPLLGTSIVGVLHTSEFEAPRASTTVELYNRLSAGRGLLPPAVGFIFDREGRSERVRQDVERHRNVRFLGRRMYENYLINPSAIAAVINAVDEGRAAPLQAADVDSWLQSHRWEAKYFETVPRERSDANWLMKVHGARVLTDVFSAMTETRVSYENEKVRFGTALTDWLLENASAALREVAELLASFLPARSEQE